MPLPAGERFGPYEIVSALGAGGMGEVYRARDTRLDRTVALKVIPQRFASDTDRLIRFEYEARAIAALNHPHICQLHDLGPGYLVLEFIEGSRLRGPLAAEQALRLALQIVGALEAAHQRGILHRDLKPANIMITRDGIAKLLDFGVAKLMSDEVDATRTLAGTVVGTAGYMSPEQAQGQALDVRSDIFSFGVVLYEMIAGTPPFSGRSTAELLSAVLRDEPRPISAPPPFELVIRRCLQKSAADRYQTMGEVRAALEPALTDSTPRSIGRQPSIAVLPFANMSADKENEYFSDGLAEEVINALAQVPGLKVAGRTSSFFFRGKDVEFLEIRRRLNVEHVLEGSVRKAGNRIRVTAQLINLVDGFHLWSERYDRELTDVFAIQDEITDAIADALRVRLAPEAAASRRHVPNLRAFESYLKARDHWYRATPESLSLAKELLDHAIVLDPEFALAHSLSGLYYSMLAALGMQSAREVIPMARAAEHEALRIDPSLPEAHGLLAVWAGTQDFAWKDAERHWRAAMARPPVSPDIRLWHGNHYLMPIGRVQEAVEVMAGALEEDPLNLLFRHNLAVGLRHAGRLDEAESELRTVLQFDENFSLAAATLGAVCAQRGRLEEALRLTERACELMPWANLTIGQLAALRRQTGATSQADALLERLRPGTAYGAPTGLAVFHAMCGEFDEAAKWAERAIDERYPPLVGMLRPLLQTSPHWPVLARMMNLPEPRASSH